MTKPAFRLAALGALALLYSAAPLGQAQAAEGHDNCDETITSAGAVIARPGTYCLKAGITSALTSGAAITINADNVTIDCNGNVIRDATTNGGAAGIAAKSRENVTVRNCSIAGFETGIDISEGAGHLIEENLIRNSRAYGVLIWGAQNSEVRRNRVFDVRGQEGAYGIRAWANVVENTVANVTSNPSNPESSGVTGIQGAGWGIEIRGNRVRGVAGFDAVGIDLNGAGVVVGNHVSGSGHAGFLLDHYDICVGNTQAGFSSVQYDACGQSLDNL